MNQIPHYYMYLFLNILYKFLFVSLRIIRSTILILILLDFSDSNNIGPFRDKSLICMDLDEDMVQTFSTKTLFLLNLYCDGQKCSFGIIFNFQNLKFNKVIYITLLEHPSWV